MSGKHVAYLRKLAVLGNPLQKPTKLDTYSLLATKMLNPGNNPWRNPSEKPYRKPDKNRCKGPSGNIDRNVIPKINQ